MIHKLRRKFILINMSFVTIVLLIVFGALCLSTYRSEKQANLSVLEKALFQAGKSYGEDPPGNEPSLKQPGNDPQQRPPRIMDYSLQERMDNLKPCVIIRTDSDGNRISFSDADTSFLEEAEILQAIDAIREQNGTLFATDGILSGLLSSMGLRYSTCYSGGHTVIALVDRSNELMALRNLSLASLIIGVASLAAFFAISLFLSALAVRPVEKAWLQQQQFIADASHELKTPLTVILANLKILKSHSRETIASQEQWLSNTQEEALRMKNLVDDLLYLARSDAGRQPVVCSDVDLSDAVLNALLPFESVAFERGLILDSQIEPGLHLHGDAGQLKQLTGILLDNACKYSVSGGTITVLLAREQNRCTLRVINQGPAIPEAEQSHLFERFYRADESRSRHAGGYGLGLAIAKSITDCHKGKISVERSDGTETVFCVQLPM